jgi:hypothetical protein
MACGMIFVYIILPLSPFIAMSFACLVEWIIKRHR